jgi:uncharacterized membrane protein YoaK (UPF0700 family)
MAGWRQAAVRDALVVLLTITTGAVDATSFLALGNVFSSVITGNLVLLGISAGTGSAVLAVHAGVALAGYTAGVAVGAPVAAQQPGRSGTWPSSVTTCLGVELCILLAFCVTWELAGARPHGTLQLVLVAPVAVAMGIQSAAVRRLGQMSSTYLTSTLTGVVAGLTSGTRAEGLPRSLGVLAAIIVGAAAGGAVVKLAPGWLPLVVLTPLAVVIAVAVAGFGPARRGGPGRDR